jgi:hypothetical protein
MAPPSPALPPPPLFHALFEAGFTASPVHAGFFALGPALELTTTRPTSLDPDVTAAGEATELSTALRAELRYELAVGHLLFGIAAIVEASLVKTRYELAGADRSEVLAEPPPFWPGAALTVAVRP